MLSTTTNAPRAWAVAATCAMSTTVSIGFVGVSIQTIRVVSRDVASSATESPRSAELHSTPARPCTRDTRRNVPPYASFGITT